MELWAPIFFNIRILSLREMFSACFGLSRGLFQSLTANYQRCATDRHKTLKQIWPQCSCQPVPSSELGHIYKHLKVKSILKSGKVSGKSRLSSGKDREI